MACEKHQYQVEVVCDNCGETYTETLRKGLPVDQAPCDFCDCKCLRKIPRWK